MMAMQASENEAAAKAVVAHSPVEKKVNMNGSFASSAIRQ
jgi:hypothetical protein